MADVKINLKINDAGALAEIKKFNEAFRQIKTNADKATSSLNKIGKEVGNTNTQFSKLNNTMSKGNKKTNAGLKKTKDNLGGIQKAGVSIKNVFAGVFIADSLRAGVRAIKDVVVEAITEFKEFELGLVGVGKTANLSGKELADFGQAIRDVDMPVANLELLEYAKTAGQLGVKGSANIIRFAKTMAKLQSATDIAGEQGASQLARILNITQEGPEQIEELGAVITNLGNNFAATESEILRVTNEVARSTAAFGISSAEATAFGAAIKSLGGRAEGSGTAIGKVFRKINEATALGGPLLEEFSKTMGITGDQLKKSFTEDKTETVLKFFKALKDGKDRGVNMAITLKNLKLDTDRLAKVVPVLADNYGTLDRAMRFANGDLKDTDALNKEAARSFDTLSGDVDKLKKSWDGLTTELLNSSLGTLFRTIVSGSQDMVEAFREGTVEKEISKLGEATAESQKEVDRLTERLETLKNLTFNDLDVLVNNLGQVGNEFERWSKQEVSEEIILRTRELKKLTQATSDLYTEQNKLKGATDAPDPEKPFAFGGRAEAEKKAQDEKTAIVKEEERVRLDITRAFRAIEADEKLDAIKAEEFNQIAQSENAFTRIEAGLGREKALLIGAQAKKLIDENAFEKAKLLIQKSYVQAKQRIADKKKKQKEKDDAKALRDEENLSRNLLVVGSAFGKEAFKLAQAYGIAEATVSGFKAIAKSAEPGWPQNIPGVVASTAQMLANIAGIKGASPSFEQGGVVPGSSFSGDNVSANVNSGEMILNRQQQANLFKVANQGGGQQQSKEIVVHTSVQVGEEEIARAVSRQVANGFELGEQT